MAIDLSTWVPKRILTVYDDHGAISSEYWSGLWNLNREQGDDTADALAAVLTRLNESVWHTTDGTAQVQYTIPTTSDYTAFKAYLLANGWTQQDIDASFPVVGTVEPLKTTLNRLFSESYRARHLHETLSDELASINNDVSTLYSWDHNDWMGREDADAHPISAITDLQDTLDNIVAGAVAVVSHNLLPNRDAADAHPLAAITGLVTALASKADTTAVTTLLTGKADAVHLHELDGVIGLEDILATLADHNYIANRAAANAHPAAAIQMTDGQTVQDRIAGILTTIASITGDVNSIEHNDLLNRTTADAHPQSAITGLSAALTTLTNDVAARLTTANAASTYLTIINAAATYQKKITSGTVAPTGGVDGDVYIQYA